MPDEDELRTGGVAVRLARRRAARGRDGEREIIPEAPIAAEGRAALEDRLSLDAVFTEYARSETAGLDVSVGKKGLNEIISARRDALTRVYTTLDVVKKDLTDYFPKVPAVLPAELDGQILNPDGSPADTVSVEALEPTYANAEDVDDDDIRWPMPRTLTDFRGAFSLRLPSVPLPEGGLKLRIRGANDATEIAIRRVDLAEGKLGTLPLDKTLTPLERSVVAELKDLVPASADDVEERPEDFAAPAPAIMLGEGDCARSFRSGSGVIDRFRYSMLIRLVEPQVTPKHLVLRAREGGGKYVPLSYRGRYRETGDGDIDDAEFINYLGDIGSWHYTERIPVDGPIDVTAFRTGLEQAPVSMPKAGTLGIGYVVSLRQVWIPAGLSLGDLLYSLALAPGEQQRVAVYERAETLTVRDSEALSIDEAQRFQEFADQSTHATFNSAFREAAAGGSRMETESRSFGAGIAGGVGGFAGVLFGVGAAVGYGSSASSGSTSSWQRGSRDFVSNAAQEFHSSLGRTSAASRRANRVGVRMATATERDEVTTKVISNHNHGHALTVQYWEVLRHYAVSSEVDDAQLVCFVPLELIQFLPDLEPREVPLAPTRSGLLRRYSMLIRYYDVLFDRLRWNPEHRQGMTLLRDFAADPTMEVASSTEGVDDVVNVTVTGTFLPFEDVYVTVVTRTGGRLGPVKLSGEVEAVPADAFSTRNQLIQYLQDRRANGTAQTRTAQVYLPGHIARSDIARFEFSRRFLPFSYYLKFELPQDGFSIWDLLRVQAERDVRYSPADLERMIGGPLVWDVRATILEDEQFFVDSFRGRPAAQRMEGLLQLPARRVVSELSFANLLRIEAVFQHVWQNTVTYSKAVWMSLTPEERAIMLERYTIGVPAGGVQDSSDEIPLLNCVANQVIGYFGNAMVMPFHIPPQLAERMKVTSRDIQEALVRFHRQAFSPPRSSITLPTQGMLGEAVLGSCNSAEKIDLTRFWDWKEATVDQADQIKPEDLAAGQEGLVGPQGAQAPGRLAPENQPIANLLNISTGENVPAPNTGLLTEMMKQAPAPTAFPDLTGRADLVKQMSETRTDAAAARTEAVNTAKSMAETVVNKLPDVIKAETEVREGKRAAQEAAEKKDAETKAEAAKTADATARSKINLLDNNIGYFIDQASEPTTDAAALTEARRLVRELFDGETPELEQLLPLYAKLKPESGDSADVKRGKTALLKALGLEQ